MPYRKILVAVLIALLSAAESKAQFTGKPRYQILTTRNGIFLGNINVELFPAIAPNHVKNFDSLISKVFFDTTAFHRVIPGFVIQGGDPNSRHGPKSTWGQGDPNQPTVNAEFSAATHKRGTLAAARDANINSANSQFYICVAPQPSLDNNYTIYGQVTSGMNFADTIVSELRDGNDCPLRKIEMFVTYTGPNDTLASVPVLDLPSNWSYNVGSVKQLKWLKKNDDVMYHLDVSTDTGFTALFKSVNVGVNYNTVVGLPDSTTFYWRVKANNGGSWSNYSTVWAFSTAGLLSVNNLSFIEKGYRLDQNIPNPGIGQIIIKYAVPGREKIVIKLFDVTGKEIAVLVNEEKLKGEYEITADMNKYPAGSYFYRMQAGEVSDTKKIISEK
ncbi:MAG: T9SS type A sorting domain-containing protein [Bacteroidetes bacterium]|nr:MAG: T9SS type A sorting domain-containing protein [Bacteroidota bacterium]